MTEIACTPTPHVHAWDGRHNATVTLCGLSTSGAQGPDMGTRAYGPRTNVRQPAVTCPACLARQTEWRSS